jgi:hypothetical protein
MAKVFRVIGPSLGDGACLRAESELQAIEIVADAFDLAESQLAAGLEVKVSMPRGMILAADGAVIPWIRDDGGRPAKRKNSPW